MATVAALAALATTAMNTFEWRDEWTQHAKARQFLQDELLAFNSRVRGDQPRGAQALDRLFAARKARADSNIEEWRHTGARAGRPGA